MAFSVSNALWFIQELDADIVQNVLQKKEPYTTD